LAWGIDWRIEKTKSTKCDLVAIFSSNCSRDWEGKETGDEKNKKKSRVFFFQKMSVSDAPPQAADELPLYTGTKAVPQLSPVLLTVLNASTDAVVITDIDATVVSVRKKNPRKKKKKKKQKINNFFFSFFFCFAHKQVNKTAERMFGYTAAEMVGRNVMFLMPEPFSTRHDSYVSRYRRTKVGHIGTPSATVGAKKIFKFFFFFFFFFFCRRRPTVVGTEKVP
jgi:hypothetical protein